MAEIKITILDLASKARIFNLPDSIPLQQMLPRILADLNAGPNCNLFYRGRQLSISQTLRSAEVGAGAELELRPTGVVPSIPPEGNQRGDTTEQRDYYVAQANSLFPMLIVYLIDVSGSMADPLGSKTRIQVAQQNFELAIKTMIKRSIRGEKIAPRYRVALFTYSDTVRDVYGGIKTIDEIAKLGIPELTASNITNTAGAFRRAQELLEREIRSLQSGLAGSVDGAYPAPMVCHLTDGEYTEADKGIHYGDPEPIVRAIMQMCVPDGHVLVENIYISGGQINTPADVKSWHGFDHGTTFPGNPYATKLLGMSSVAPTSYIEVMSKDGYQIAPGSALFYPGTSSELIRMAFQMSVATQYGKR